MKKPKYFLSPTSSSTCPNCKNQVRMLATRDVFDAPAFYLCRVCNFVGQIGKGRVHEFKEEQPTPEEELTKEQQAYYIEKAKKRFAEGSDDAIEIDDPTEFSIADDGVWVKGWLWIAKRLCDICAKPYDEAKGDGYCGLCPKCADESEPAEDE